MIRVGDTRWFRLKPFATRILNIVSEVQRYVPGYRLRVPPQMDGDKVSVVVQVQGQGDFLPRHLQAILISSTPLQSPRRANRTQSI
jgi:acetaldehyde dehydrogenase